jgi:hypothetical protein
LGRDGLSVSVTTAITIANVLITDGWISVGIDAISSNIIVSSTNSVGLCQDSITILVDIIVITLMRSILTSSKATAASIVWLLRRGTAKTKWPTIIVINVDILVVIDIPIVLTLRSTIDF